MRIDLEQYRIKSKSKRQENKKFFRQLKTRKPKVMDQQIHDLHDSVFQEVDCLSFANCCKTTGPLFTHSDINRIAKHLGMKTTQFIEEYLRLDEDGDNVLQKTPCSFLGEDNYCSIYDVRPKACREFPHTDRYKMHQILELTRKNTEVCPAVLEIVERMK